MDENLGVHCLSMKPATQAHSAFTLNEMENESVAVRCGWEENHTSDTALAVCHRLCGISTYRHYGLTKGDEHSTCTSAGLWHLHM